MYSFKLVTILFSVLRRVAVEYLWTTRACVGLAAPGAYGCQQAGAF
jgi:hypothetical protein